MDWRVTDLPVDGEKQLQKKKKSQDTEAIIAEATKVRKQKQQKAAAAAAPPAVSSDEESDAEADADGAVPAKKPKEEAPKVELPTVVGIEDAGMHHVLKKIIKNDQKREDAPFAFKLLEHLSSEVVSGTRRNTEWPLTNPIIALQLKSWLGINRACYVLVKLVENSPAVLARCRTALEEQQLQSLLLEQKTPGAKMLASKLDFKQ